LERLSAAARRSPEAGVVAGATVKVCPGGRREKLPHFDLTDAFAALCCEGRIAIHSALVRAERVRDVRGFDQSLGTNEDWDLWQRLARTGVTFAQIPQVVAFYRNTPGSLSKDPLRVARDGLAVMRRGHGPDPRVVAAPALAMGAPADAYPCRAHYFALWCGARLIAQGGDGAAVASLLPPGGCDAEPLSLGALIASGMADVLGQPERALGSRWAEFEPKLTDLLALLGHERARQQGLTLAVIKARLNAGAVDPGRLEMARDPRAPPSTQIVQLTWKGRSLGAVAMPSLAPRGASLVEAAAAQVRRLPLREGIRASDAWRSPSFWTASLAGLASRSAAGLLLDPPQLRPVLRQALADGVAAMVRARLRRRAADAPDAHQQALAERAAAACADAARFARSLNEPPPRAPARSGAAQPRVGTGARSVPVLMYHRIANDPVPGLERYCLAPERFEAQLRWLRAEGYSPVTPAEVLSFMRCQAGLPARPVMLTFDDGYIDFYQNAWPRLHRFGMSAIVYAVTGLVGGRAVWDAGAGVPAALMDWDQLRTLSERGIAVESHGHSHRHMSRLPTEALYDEALRSRALLEKVLGQAPASFCYPYGAHDPAAERVLEECGYRLAFTTREGVCSLAEEPLRAPRIEVAAADDLSVFRRKLSDASQR
jgi:peptidoglycan/xylan/chitin deacetylase (PgdA/CDA1 family)